MKNREIETYLHDAVAHSVPDVLEQVVSGCERKREKVIEMTSNKKHIKRWAAVAAAVVILALAGVGVGAGAYYHVDSIIALDVNPSVELKINRGERVLEANAKNGDGELILKDMDLKNTDLDVAVNAIIGSMLKNGFIDELQNSILISVEGENGEKCDSLKQKIAQEIDSLLRSSSVDGSVLSQVVPIDDEALRTLAEENGISLGKASLIQKIIEKNPALKFEELAKMPINDLNLLSESKNASLDNVSVSGSASDKAYIGEEKAKQAAFDRAGVKAAGVSRLEVELDCENGAMVYEVEFYSGGREYDVTVDALTGKILFYDTEADKTPGRDDDDKDDDRNDDNDRDDDDYSASSRPDNGSGSNVSSRPNGGNGNSSAARPNDKDDDDGNHNTQTSSTAQASYIGAQKAKEIAFRHAGVSASSAKKVEAELEKGRNPHYDISFISGNTEYDYEIDAVSGKILDYEKEYTHDGNQSASSAAPSKQLIGESRAREIALKHAGLSQSAVRELECELDRDDGTVVYEVSFKNGGFEYQYDIDAYSGSIRDFEKEKDD